MRFITFFLIVIVPIGALRADRSVEFPEITVSKEGNSYTCEAVIYPVPLLFNNWRLEDSSLQTPPPWYTAFRAKTRPESFESFDAWKQAFAQKMFANRPEAFSQQKFDQYSENPGMVAIPEGFTTVTHEFRFTDNSTEEKYIFVVMFLSRINVIPMSIDESRAAQVHVFQLSPEHETYVNTIVDPKNPMYDWAPHRLDLLLGQYDGLEPQIIHQLIINLQGHIQSSAE